MIEKFLIIAIALTAIHGNAVPPAGKNGALNKYYLFKRGFYNDGMGIPLPTLRDLDEIEPEVITPIYDQIEEFDYDMNTTVIVHGHNGNLMTRLNTEIINAFGKLSENDENIIVVDWSTYTGQSYSFASAAVASVGHELGLYLTALIDRNYFELSRLHLVGFNLGAHAVGIAGRTLEDELGEKVARITGLDPSGSQWGSNTPRLAIGDARYVEVIHTDGDGLLANGIGTAIGNADFFINGGSNQPGCLTHACSHDRAWELFADTISRTAPLQGYLCTNNLQLSLNRCISSPLGVGGLDFSKLLSTPGGENIYRVNTGRRPPY